MAPGVKPQPYQSSQFKSWKASSNKSCGSLGPTTQRPKNSLDTLVLSESVEEALRKVAKQDAVPMVIQMQRKCLHLVHLSKRRLKLQATLDGLEEQQKSRDELKEAARERSEKLEEQVAQTMVERDSLISATHQADAAGTSPGAQNKVQEAATGAPVPSLVPSLPTNDLLTQFTAHLPVAGADMVEMLKQFRNIKETLEASLANNAVPSPDGTSTPAARPTGSGTSGAQTTLALRGTKVDVVRDRTRSPDSKRRAVGEKGDDVEA